MYRPVFGWDGGYALTQLSVTEDCTTYFCVNYSQDVILRFVHILEKDPGVARQPFFLDALTADDSMNKWSKHMEDNKLHLLEYVC